MVHILECYNLRPFRRELWYGQITITMLKSKGKTCMAEEPSQVKQLSINQVCKIGLRIDCHFGFFVISFYTASYAFL